MLVTERNSFRRIVWSFAIAETVVWAAFYYSFPAFLLEWERSLSWSKMELAGAFTSALILSALFAPVAGWLIDRGFARQMFTGSALLGAAFLALMSFVTELWQFYAVWLGLGISMAGALYEACFAIITRTVGNQSKKSITLITLVAGFAGTVSFPVAHALVEVIGWRGAIRVFAGAVIFIAVPLIWIGCGYADKHLRDMEPSDQLSHSSAKWVLRSWVFWSMALAFAAIAVEHGVIITHLLLILDDRSVNPEVAVFAASMIGPMQVLGRLVMIVTERYVSMFNIAIGSFIAMGLAAASLLGADGITGLVVTFVILHGAGYGVTSITRPIITAELLGKQNFGAISGLLAVPFMFGFALAPTLAAMIWQVGGYDLVLRLAVLVSAIGLGALLLAGKCRKTNS